MRFAFVVLIAFASSSAFASEPPPPASMACQLPITFDVDSGFLRTLPFGGSSEIKDLPAFYCDGVTLDRMNVKKRLQPKTGSVDLEIEIVTRVRRETNDKVVAFEFTLLDGEQQLLLGRRDGLTVDAGDSEELAVHFWIPKETLAPYTAEGSNPRLRVSMIFWNHGSAETTSFASAPDAELAAASFAPARAGGDGHVNFFIGMKSLDRDYWANMDHQGEFGAVMSFGRVNWPVHIAVDVLTSDDEHADFDGSFGMATTTGSTLEVDAGVRKIWKRGKILPYIGGGLGYFTGKFNIDTGPNRGHAEVSDIGIWADTGVFFRLGSHFNIGLDVRWSHGFDDEVLFTAPQLTVGGTHVGLIVGFGW